MRWMLRDCDLSAADNLARATGLPTVVARLLIQRGLSTPEAVHEFLHPSLEHLHSPFAMCGMDVAVERVERAIAQRENILIYGDYDVDGTVAVVILKTGIELLGGVTDFHVPHRIREGYGMKDDVIERAAAGGVTLVISVDTGIRAFQAAETAKRVGIDLIVTDHHLPEAEMGVPQALAVLNPNQAGCDYPCKDLCGAGVVFKITQALLSRAGKERLLPSFLKMVALATIADAVSLSGENRVIAKLGLEGLRQPVNGGLKALMQVSQLDGKGRGISSTDVAFRLAPRINAAGRMDIARDVVELFTCKNSPREMELANKLNALNAERQNEEQRIVDEVKKRLDEDESLHDAYCVVIDGEGWHRGVIGIVATRVVERTSRPALVISRDRESGEAHGSGRSISGFHLLQALESEGCRHLFTRFGGHAHAVGFALPSDKVAALRSAADAYARTRLRPEDLVPTLRVDAEIEFGEISKSLLMGLRALEPFGAGNPQPVLLARNVKVLRPPEYMKEKHVKLRVAAAGAPKLQPYDAIGWRMAETARQENYATGDVLDLAFRIDENDHPEFGGLQLILSDVRRATVSVGAD